MDFTTPRPPYVDAPSGFYPMPTEDDVFAAQFAAFVGNVRGGSPDRTLLSSANKLPYQEPVHHDYSVTSSAWSSDRSSPSYSVDTSTMILDSADESASSSSTEGQGGAVVSKKSKRPSRYKEPCTEEVLVVSNPPPRAQARNSAVLVPLTHMSPHSAGESRTVPISGPTACERSNAFRSSRSSSTR